MTYKMKKKNKSGHLHMDKEFNKIKEECQESSTINGLHPITRQMINDQKNNNKNNEKHRKLNRIIDLCKSYKKYGNEIPKKQSKNV